MTEEINKTIEILSRGGLILYPTDTVWCIGCDATNEVAVQKTYTLKQRNDNEMMICMVANDAMLEKHVAKVPDLAYDIIDISTKPTTIIYDEPQGLAKNVVCEDQTIAIRVASDKFCQYLINKFKRPIVSTSADITTNKSPIQFSDIDQSILKGVDYIVNLHQDKVINAPSAIIKLSNDGTVKVIRK